MTYTVILLYADHIANQYGETFTSYVEASNGDEAVKKAQQACLEANGIEDVGVAEHNAPIAVFEGELIQVKWG